jgi:hypothetical protein
MVLLIPSGAVVAQIPQSMSDSPDSDLFACNAQAGLCILAAYQQPVFPRYSLAVR